MTVNSSNSLGAQLSTWLALQVFLSFFVVSLIVFFVINNYLSTRQFEELEEKRVHVDHMFEEALVNDAFADLRHKLDDFLASHHELQIEILKDNGALLYKGGNQFTKAINKDSTQLTFSTPNLPGAELNGVATIYFDNSADRLLLTWLAIALAISSVLAAFTVAFGAAWLVRRELRSVDILVQQLHQIGASTLGSRLDGALQPRELRPIVTHFNNLLDRLYDSYRQLENFNADVAHELNTPLTTLITSCELELRNANKKNNMYEVLGSNLEELHRMSEIINSMMFLSRAERGSRPRCVRVSSIAEIGFDVAVYHEAMLGEANMEISVVGDSEAELDIPLIKRALSNLFSNAIQYATPGSTILLEIEHVDSVYVNITVSNQGQPIGKDALGRLFDRFYRAEVSRSMADKHHGLGLSIVAAIAKMHGGEPHVESNSSQTRIGFTLRKFVSHTTLAD